MGLSAPAASASTDGPDISFKIRWWEATAGESKVQQTRRRITMHTAFAISEKDVVIKLAK
jgi:isocitrate dehydrogenase